MKQTYHVLLAVCFVFICTFSNAYAAEIKVNGSFDVTMQRLEHANFLANNPSSDTWDNFAIGQLFTLQLQAIVSERLSATLKLSAGATTWGYDGALGSTSQGGGIGGNIPVSVEKAYLDFIVPSTDISIRLGYQDFTLPSTSLGSAILDKNGAGIQVNIPVNDDISFDLFWLRPYAGDVLETTSDPYINNFRTEGYQDFFGISAPMSFADNTFALSPWFMYGRLGKEVFNSFLNNLDELDIIYPALPNWAGTNSYGYTGYLDSLLPVILPQNSDGSFNADTSNAFFGGLTAIIEPFDRTTLSLDANYGSSGQSDEWSRQGYFLSALGEYAFDWGIPGLYGWYASGDDSKLSNGSERLASVSPLWGNTGLGFSGQYSISYGNSISISPAGTWGIALQAKHLHLIESVPDLSHFLVLAYYRGTNNTQMASYLTGSTPLPSGYYSTYGGGNSAGITPFSYLTTEDSAIEFTFNSTYDIYKELQTNLEFSYIWQNFSKKTWVSAAGEEPDFADAWKIALNLKYTF